MCWGEIEWLYDIEMGLIENLKKNIKSSMQEEWIVVSKPKRNTRTNNEDGEYLVCRRCKNIFFWSSEKKKKYDKLNWNRPKDCNRFQCQNTTNL